MLAGAFNEFGVSKIQGFQGKYIKYELGQKYHRTCIVKSNCDHTIYGKLDRKGSALHGAKIFSSMGIIVRYSALITLLIIWQPGALVSFFNYIPGLLFPKKIM